MHVVVASHHRLPVEGYGGPQRVVVALVEGLAAHGHRVTVLAQPGTKLPAAARVSSRVRRTDTSANSAPTKKPFATTKNKTANNFAKIVITVVECCTPSARMARE